MYDNIDERYWFIIWTATSPSTNILEYMQEDLLNPQTFSHYWDLGDHLNNKLHWTDNTNAVYKKGLTLTCWGLPSYTF